MCRFEMFLTPVENFLSFVKTKVELKFAHRKPYLAQAKFSPFRKLPTRLIKFISIKNPLFLPV